MSRTARPGRTTAHNRSSTSTLTALLALLLGTFLTGALATPALPSSAVAAQAVKITDCP